VTWRSALAVALAGAAGSLARWAIDILVGSSEVSTLAVNVAGALALGWLLARPWGQLPAWLSDGLGVGFLGSFTTMSGVALLAIPGVDWWWAGYTAVTLTLGTAAVVAGWHLAQRYRSAR